ncbi:hypothetical protein MASR1M90_19420 [Desulfovibrionales bacterium]
MKATGRYPSLYCHVPLLFMTFLMFFVQHDYAAAQTPEQTLAELRQQAASINSIQSLFTQTTRIPLFQDPVHSKGRFLFRRPDALLWEITAPITEGFAFMGDRGMRWEAGKPRTTFAAATDPVATIIARQLLVWLTLDMVTIEKEYTITVTANSPRTLLLEPKKNDIRCVIRSLTLLFSPQGVAKQVTLEEANGGTTLIQFTDTQVNITLPDAAFL